MSYSSSDILPVNGPAKYCFKLADLDKVKLKDFPPKSIEKTSFDKALMLLSHQWDWLSPRTIWAPYPIFSFCEGWAEGDPNSMNGFYLLFSMVDAEYQGQALARVNVQTEITGSTEKRMAWVDALGEEELDEDNKRELATALENQKIKETLIELNIIGKKCSYSNHRLEIKNQSDTNVIDIRGGVIVMKNKLGEAFNLSINEIDEVQDNSTGGIMSIQDELRQLVGKKCWFSGHTLEIRKKSDAEIISVDNERVVLKHFFGQVHHIPISEIWSIVRKDI